MTTHSATQTAAEIAARFEQVTDSRDLDALDSVCSPDLVNHSLAPERASGVAGTREYLTSPTAARFAGETWRHRTVVCDGEYVVHHGIRTGHWPGGEFFGFHANEGDYDREVMFMYRVRDGRVVERWAVRDDIGFLRQLGAAAPAGS